MCQPLKSHEYLPLMSKSNSSYDKKTDNVAVAEEIRYFATLKLSTTCL